MVPSLWKIELKIELPYDPIIPLGHIPEQDSLQHNFKKPRYESNLNVH